MKSYEYICWALAIVTTVLIAFAVHDGNGQAEIAGRLNKGNIRMQAAAVASSEAMPASKTSSPIAVPDKQIEPNEQPKPATTTSHRAILKRNSHASAAEANRDTTGQTPSSNTNKSNTELPEKIPTTQSAIANGPPAFIPQGNAASEKEPRESRALSHPESRNALTPAQGQERGNATFERKQGVWQPTIGLSEFPRNELLSQSDVLLIAKTPSDIFRFDWERQRERSDPIVNRYVPSTHWTDVVLTADYKTQQSAAACLSNKFGHTFTAGGSSAVADRQTTKVQIAYLVSHRLLSEIRSAQHAKAASLGVTIEDLEFTGGSIKIHENTITYEIDTHRLFSSSDAGSRRG